MNLEQFINTYNELSSVETCNTKRQFKKLLDPARKSYENLKKKRFVETTLNKFTPSFIKSENQNKSYTELNNSQDQQIQYSNANKMKLKDLMKNKEEKQILHPASYSKERNKIIDTRLDQKAKHMNFINSELEYKFIKKRKKSKELLQKERKAISRVSTNQTTKQSLNAKNSSNSFNQVQTRVNTSNSNNNNNEMIDESKKSKLFDYNRTLSTGQEKERYDQNKVSNYSLKYEKSPSKDNKRVTSRIHPTPQELSTQNSYHSQLFHNVINEMNKEHISCELNNHKKSMGEISYLSKHKYDYKDESNNDIHINNDKTQNNDKNEELDNSELIHFDHSYHSTYQTLKKKQMSNFKSSFKLNESKQKSTQENYSVCCPKISVITEAKSQSPDKDRKQPLIIVDSESKYIYKNDEKTDKSTSKSISTKSNRLNQELSKKNKDNSKSPERSNSSHRVIFDKMEVRVMTFQETNKSSLFKFDQNQDTKHKPDTQTQLEIDTKGNNPTPVNSQDKMKLSSLNNMSQKVDQQQKHSIVENEFLKDRKQKQSENDGKITKTKKISQSWDYLFKVRNKRTIKFKNYDISKDTGRYSSADSLFSLPTKKHRSQSSFKNLLDISGNQFINKMRVKQGDEWIQNRLKERKPESPRDQMMIRKQ